MLGGLKGTIVNFVIRKVKKMVPPFRLEGSIALKGIFKESLGKKGAHIPLTKNDTAFLQYTGGTTEYLKVLN